MLNTIRNGQKYGQNETARRPLIWFLVVVETFAVCCIQPRRLYSLNTAAVCYTQRGGRCSFDAFHPFGRSVNAAHGARAAYSQNNRTPPIFFAESLCPY